MTEERQGITPPPVLDQDDLIECLRWSAFKMCGRGPHEDYASDAMTMALERIAELEIEAEAQYHRGYYDGRAALGETK